MEAQHQARATVLSLGNNDNTCIWPMVLGTSIVMSLAGAGVGIWGFLSLWTGNGAAWAAMLAGIILGIIGCIGCCCYHQQQSSGVVFIQQTQQPVIMPQPFVMPVAMPTTYMQQTHMHQVQMQPTPVAVPIQEVQMQPTLVPVAAAWPPTQ